MFKVLCFLVVSFLIVFSSAAPLDKDSEAKILNNEYTIDEKGNYRFSFETSNGITRVESGLIVNEGQTNEHIKVIGYYSYYNNEGQKETVVYTADDNGYNTPPPAPQIPIEMTVLSAPPSVVATLLGK